MKKWTSREWEFAFDVGIIFLCIIITAFLALWRDQ